MQCIFALKFFLSFSLVKNLDCIIKTQIVYKSDTGVKIYDRITYLTKQTFVPLQKHQILFQFFCK